ncbi:MAG TPA: cell envelope integrity protein TolA [Thermoanaerobaculia bacterium]|nr:cell envelope integrity protein TolA [Thermoanaerobaculia bacterium]
MGTRALSDAGLGPFRVQGPPIPFAGAIYASAIRQGIGQQIWRLAGGRDTQVTRLRHLAKGLYPSLAVPVGDRVVIRSFGFDSSDWYALAADGSAEKLPVYEEGCTFYLEIPLPFVGRELWKIDLSKGTP